MRNGGGSKQFIITKESFTDHINIKILKYGWRDTLLIIPLSKNSSYEKLINSIDSLFNGQLIITGKFKQPTLPTGTWSYFYLYTDDNQKCELTNSELRLKLLSLETYVEQEIRKNTK